MVLIWTNKWTWFVLGISFVILLVLACLYVVVSLYDNRNADKQRRDAAIVLGASLWHNQPSPALRERLNTALQLYRTGKIDMFILSGGLGKDGVDRTEAEAMKEYLMRFHIPPNKMILEGKSHNTRENLQNTANLLKHTPIKSLYVVTNDFHMTRAMLYAKQANLKVAPAPAHSTVLFGPYHKLRECFALIKLYLFD